MTAAILPISAVVATRNRSGAFRRTLDSLVAQVPLPAELVVVDGSDDTLTAEMCCGLPNDPAPTMVYLRADKLGAAAQRNQGVAAASHDFILFHDDDIIFEPHCIARLWAALNSSSLWGGINAMISNQQYSTPGRVTGPVLRILGGAPGADYAGRVIGPGVNLLPADRPTMPDVVPVDWLSTTCTLYRREALPVPPFLAHFTGYSLMEDLALSLMVGKSWKLANARTARIFHDSQPGDHKNNHAQLAEMELVNRHFVMTKVLGLSRPSDYLRLGMWEAFVLAATVPFGFHRLAAETWGKTKGLLSLLRRAAG